MKRNLKIILTEEKHFYLSDDFIIWLRFLHYEWLLVDRAQRLHTTHNLCTCRNRSFLLLFSIHVRKYFFSPVLFHFFVDFQRIVYLSTFFCLVTYEERKEIFLFLFSVIVYPLHFKAICLFFRQFFFVSCRLLLFSAKHGRNFENHMHAEKIDISLVIQTPKQLITLIWLNNCFKLKWNTRWQNANFTVQIKANFLMWTSFLSDFFPSC